MSRMRRIFVAFLLFASSLTADVRSREPFKVPGCDVSAADRGFTLSRITYDSDDLTVSAYLYEPAVAPQTPLPVLVFIRGSYLREKFPEEALPVMRSFGAAGFITIAPMIRQSDGSGGRDEVGGADLNDVMNTLEIIRELPNADSTNIFMYGHSRGGVMTYL